MIDDGIKFSHVSRIINSNRPAIYVPLKVMRALGDGEYFVKFTITHENLLLIDLCDKNGNLYEHRPNRPQEDILRCVNGMVSNLKQIRAKTDRMEEAFLYPDGSARFNTVEPALYNPGVITSDEDMDLTNIIPITEKMISSYKYHCVFEDPNPKYYELYDELIKDCDYVNGIEIEFGDMKVLFKDDVLYIIIPDGCDWEIPLKYERLIPFDEFMKVKCRFYILDERGNATQITFDDFYPNEKNALYVFKEFNGEEYYLSRGELWFNPFYADIGKLTVKELLAKELLEKYKNNEIDELLDEEVLLFD